MSEVLWDAIRVALASTPRGAKQNEACINTWTKNGITLERRGAQGFPPGLLLGIAEDLARQLAEALDENDDLAHRLKENTAKTEELQAQLAEARGYGYRARYLVAKETADGALAKLAEARARAIAVMKKIPAGEEAPYLSDLIGLCECLGVWEVRGE